MGKREDGYVGSSSTARIKEYELGFRPWFNTTTSTSSSSPSTLTSSTVTSSSNDHVDTSSGHVPTFVVANSTHQQPLPSDSSTTMTPSWPQHPAMSLTTTIHANPNVVSHPSSSTPEILGSSPSPPPSSTSAEGFTAVQHGHGGLHGLPGQLFLQSTRPRNHFQRTPTTSLPEASHDGSW